MVPTTEGFQFETGQVATQFYWSSLSQEKLGQMNFWGPLQPGLFHGSVILWYNLGQVHTAHRATASSKEIEGPDRVCTISPVFLQEDVLPEMHRPPQWGWHLVAEVLLYFQAVCAELLQLGQALIVQNFQGRGQNLPLKDKWTG